MPENENNERYVLFSPIGMTDPVNGNYDGPFLHIIRKYKPEAAMLFMSGEVCETHKRDDRFRIFANKVSPNTVIKIDAHPDFKDVHSFEKCDDMFLSSVEKLHEEYPDCKLLVNITSGTAQMLSTLYLMTATLPFEITPIQVVSPAGASNKGPKSGDYANFNIEKEWDELKDNDPNHKDRCIEIKLKNVRLSMLKKSIEGRAEAYDYSGALAITESMPELFSPRIIALLNAASLRFGLESEKAQEALTEAHIDVREFFPDIDDELKPCYEYILMLSIYLKRHAYGDFARSISPALTSLMTISTKDKFGLDVEKTLCSVPTTGAMKGTCMMFRDKVERYDPKLLAYLDDLLAPKKKKDAKPDEDKSKQFRNTPLAAANLMWVLDYLYGDSEKDELYNDFEKLRDFEGSVRNLAAHELTPITIEKIESRADTTPDKVMEILHCRFEALLNSEKTVAWDGYDKMNAAILAEK